MPRPPKDETREHDAQYDCEYQIAQVVEAHAALREQSDHAALYLGRIGDLPGERDAASTAPNRGSDTETHDDPPVAGGYSGMIGDFSDALDPACNATLRRA